MNDQPATTPQESNGDTGFDSIRAEISREMVRLYKELFGRGPTKARTEFAGPDIVICSLENTFTPAERSLAEMGEHQRSATPGCTFRRRPRTGSARSSSGSPAAR
jgi:hypothetical protein